MSSLFNKRIKDTYSSLIKTEDNLPIGLTYSRLTDGDGNTINMLVKQGSIAFDGVLDLTDVNILGGFGQTGPAGPTGPAAPINGFNSNSLGEIITGTTSETISQSFLVPANTFQDYDWLVFNASIKKDTTNFLTTATFRIKANTTNSLSGATQIGTLTLSTDTRHSYFIRNIRINSANGSGQGTSVFPTTSSANFDYTNQITAGAPNILNIDWTNDVWIILTGQLNNANDSIQVLGYSLATTKGSRGEIGPTGPAGDITSVGPSEVNFIWAGTETEYNNLGTYSANTLYFIKE